MLLRRVHARMAHPDGNLVDALPCHGKLGAECLPEVLERPLPEYFPDPEIGLMAECPLAPVPQDDAMLFKWLEDFPELLSKWNSPLLVALGFAADVDKASRIIDMLPLEAGDLGRPETGIYPQGKNGLPFRLKGVVKKFVDLLLGEKTRKFLLGPVRAHLRNRIDTHVPLSPAPGKEGADTPEVAVDCSFTDHCFSLHTILPKFIGGHFEKPFPCPLGEPGNAGAVIYPGGMPSGGFDLFKPFLYDAFPGSGSSGRDTFTDEFFKAAFFGLGLGPQMEGSPAAAPLGIPLDLVARPSSPNAYRLFSDPHFSPLWQNVAEWWQNG